MTNNKLLYQRDKHKFFIFLLFVFIITQSVYAMDEENTFWQNYQKWFEYKKNQSLNELQKKVVLYFEKANIIFEKADDTWGRSIKRPELPNPQDALKTVNKCINEFSKLKPPVVTKKHHTASLELLGIIKKYHLKRISDPNSSDLELLSRSAISYEGIQSSEYFRIMKESGLFDNIEEEMKNISDNSGENKTISSP